MYFTLHLMSNGFYKNFEKIFIAILYSKIEETYTVLVIIYILRNVKRNLFLKMLHTLYIIYNNKKLTDQCVVHTVLGEQLYDEIDLNHKVSILGSSAVLVDSTDDTKQNYNEHQDLNLTKTKVRNKLQVLALNGLLLSSELINRTSCVKFEPTKFMISSMNVTMYNKPTDVIVEKNLYHVIF
ncbi:Uncharacterized protein FWK35_00017652, partial [Aphis craccivora]